MASAKVTTATAPATTATTATTKAACCGGSTTNGVAPFKVSGILLSSLWSNTATVRKDAIALITKIVENILKNPAEQKFRSVNIEKTRAKLEPAAGAADFLLAAGFKKTATHYDLPADADLDVLSAYHNALSEHDAKMNAEVMNSMSADAKANLEEVRKLTAEKEAKRKEARQKEEMRKKDRAQDWKPAVASTANNLKFGATKGVLPPPAKKCGPSA